MKKRKFELYQGIHQENEVTWDEELQEWIPVLDRKGKPTFRTYKVTRSSGPVIVESHRDLAKLFVNRFKEILPAPPAPSFQEQPTAMSSSGEPATQTSVERAKVASEDAAKSATTSPKVAHGTNVTHDFKGAKDANVSIFDRNGRFVIAEENGDLYDNGKLMSRKQVEQILADLVPA